jgi:hypothetical protein
MSATVYNQVGGYTNDENPLPTLQRCLVVQTLIHCCHHDACKHATDLPNCSEYGSTFCNFQWLTETNVSSRKSQQIDLH